MSVPMEMIDCEVCKKAFSIVAIFDHAVECRQEVIEKRADKWRAEKLVDGRLLDFLLGRENTHTKCPSISCILDDKLFLGSVSAALDTDSLREHKIASIVNCAREIKPLEKNDQIKDYLHLPVHKGMAFDIFDFLHEGADKLHEWIGTKNQRALVHCALGVSRSCSVLLAYLVKYEDMSLLEALVLVKHRRSIVYPNKGFLLRLIEFEREVRKQSSVPFEILELHHCLDQTALKRRQPAEPAAKDSSQAAAGGHCPPATAACEHVVAEKKE